MRIGAVKRLFVKSALATALARLERPAKTSALVVLKSHVDVPVHPG
jgi:hypothetical protein